MESSVSCKTCINGGWETYARVSACNCCEDFEFYQEDPKLVALYNEDSDTREE